MKAENESEKENIHPMHTIMSREVGVELIWAANEEFDLPAHCKYMAMDLFSKFVVKQVDSLVEYVLKTSKGSDKKEKMVKELEKRVKAQSPLRALTCLMIASKLVSHKKSLDAKILYKFIKKLDMTYNVKQIVRSEARILEQLEYKCAHTSSLMVYVGLVVAAVGLWEGMINKEVKQVQAEHLYEASMCLLDIAYLNHEKLYQELFFLITGSRVISESLRPAYARVVADRFLLAASTVVGGGWMLGGESLSDSIISSINIHIHLPVEDLESMTACLLNVAGLSFLVSK